MRHNKGIWPIAFLMALTVALPLAAESDILKLEATASYYGDEFNGRPTSSGEMFDMNAFTAAHKTLPFGTMLELTNLENGKKAVVRVNDRGPFVEDRELDVSKAAAIQLGMIAKGTARVSIRKIGDTGAPVASAAGATPVAGAQVATPAPAASPTAVAATTGAEAPSVVAAPVLANAPGALQWRIQLGSFSHEENASKLVIRLRKDGFNPAYEKTGALTRVVLAGIADKELKAVREKLDASGYGSYIVRQEAW